MKNVLLVIIVLFSIKGFNQTEESEIKEVKIPEATMIKLVVDEFTDVKPRGWDRRNTGWGHLLQRQKTGQKRQR